MPAVAPATPVRPATKPISSIRAAPDLIRTSFTALGTFGVLLVTRQSAAHQARATLAAELRAIDVACSRFRPDSELTRLNQAGGHRQRVSPLLAEALAVALRAAAATSGDVDPTCGRALVRLGYDRDFAELARRQPTPAGPVRPVPMAGWRCVDLDQDALTVQMPAGVQLDLGATAKALAADRAARAIAATTAAGALVNLGGDIAVAGPSPAAGWRVEIAREVASASPSRPVVVALWDGGLATSGTCSRAWRRGGQAAAPHRRPAHRTLSRQLLGHGQCRGGDLRRRELREHCRHHQVGRRAGLAGGARAAGPARACRRRRHHHRGLAG